MPDVSMAVLERLMATISPSGSEQDAAAVWREEAESFADRVWRDAHGNSVALVNEGGSGRIMLAGHVDEIGLMVTYIDENGFLYVQTIGGWDPQMLPGQRVRIKTSEGLVPGVVGKKPIHLIDSEECSKAVKVEDVWIDIGATDQAEAQELVAIGDPAVIAYGFESLRNGLLVSRGFDDRVGAFVVLEAARQLAELSPDVEVCAVATVQEEIGLRGARTSAYGIDPDAGIAVDVDFATDHPSMDRAKKRLGEIQMGEGPVVLRGPNMNPRLVEALLETAREREIPHQIVGYPSGTPTDANPIQLTRSGVATSLVGIPNRYMHTPSELVHRDDLAHAAGLIAHTLAGLGPSPDWTL